MPREVGYFEGVQKWFAHQAANSTKLNNSQLKTDMICTCNR